MFRVLLIDDTPIYLTIVRAVLENNLRGIPHEIVEADDGLPGIKHYKDAIASGQPFNLVVTDYVMNHSASYVLSSIRDELKHKNIPVVVVSKGTQSDLKAWEDSVSYWNPSAFLDKNDLSWSDKGPVEFQKIVAAAVKEAQQTGSNATSSDGGALDKKRMPQPPPGLREHHKARLPIHLLPARVRH